MTVKLASRIAVLTAFSATLLAATTALAQPAPAAAPAAGATGGKDHDQAVGKIGVGWYGISEIPIATGLNPQTGEITTGTAVAPAIGARYWISDFLGIDAGLGFVMTSGARETKNGGQTETRDDPSVFGMLIHGGVPLALASGNHYIFAITPEVNVGFASSTISAPNTPDINLGGFLLNVGARAGTEIQFGFMGIPQLALEGSVGLFFQTTSASADTQINGQTVEASQSQTIITTSSFNQPWDIFRSTVAARYYFF